MSYLIVDEKPTLRSPEMIVAFAGWPDAGECATGSARYLVRELNAQKFAEIDPEEFYDFTLTRPKSAVVDSSRVVTWPVNAFYYARQPLTSHDLVVFVATEPHLKWKTYTREVAGLAQELNVARVFTLGGTFDSVPHAGEVKVTGSSNNLELKNSLAELNLFNSGYQGPTSIHSVLQEELLKRGVSSGSIWGHCPHYVQVAPNWKVCHAMLRKLRTLLDLRLPLDDLREAGIALDRQVDQLVANDPKLKAYVKMLEEQHEVIEDQATEHLDAEAIMRDLDDFFKHRRGEGGDRGPS